MIYPDKREKKTYHQYFVHNLKATINKKISLQKWIVMNCNIFVYLDTFIDDKLKIYIPVGIRIRPHTPCLTWEATK